MVDAMNQKQFAQYIQSSEISAQLVQWIGHAFYGQEDSLCAVTLTFKPTIKFHEASRSKDIAHFLRRLNFRVFGQSFKKGRARLKCVPVFETNRSGGLHVHMFLERPAETARLDKSFEEVVLSEWLELEYAGKRVAQDVRACHNVSGWANYITEDIRSGDMLMKIDFANMHIAA